VSLRAGERWGVDPYLARQVNTFVDELAAEEAIAMGAHYALGVPYVKIGVYLNMSPRRVKNIATEAMRKMQYRFRAVGLMPWSSSFSGVEAMACPLFPWLADEFEVDVAWSPFGTWLFELVAGIEARPCRGCGEPIFTEVDELASLGTGLGRPRY
jgi:hypothetical protein